MWAIFTNAINYFFRLFFAVAPIKFLILVGLALLFDVLLDILFSFLPPWLNPQNILNQIPDSMGFFLNLSALDIGFPLMMSALATRFLIRRIPFIG